MISYTKISAQQVVPALQRLCETSFSLSNNTQSSLSSCELDSVQVVVQYFVYLIWTRLATSRLLKVKTHTVTRSELNG